MAKEKDLFLPRKEKRVGVLKQRSQADQMEVWALNHQSCIANTVELVSGDVSLL